MTLSRAKSILILIGNPNTLNKNSEFEYIIKECQRHNTFVGQKQKNDDETLLNQSMREMSLSNETINDTNQPKRTRNRQRGKRKNRGGGNKSSSKQTQNNDNVANDSGEKTSENKKTQRGRMCKLLSNLIEIIIKLILLTKRNVVKSNSRG